MCGNHFFNVIGKKDVIFLFLNFHYETLQTSTKVQQIIERTIHTPTLEQILTFVTFVSGLPRKRRCGGQCKKGAAQCPVYAASPLGRGVLAPGDIQDCQGTVRALRNGQTHTRSVRFIPMVAFANTDSSCNTDWRLSPVGTCGAKALLRTAGKCSVEADYGLLLRCVHSFAIIQEATVTICIGRLSHVYVDLFQHVFLGLRSPSQKFCTIAVVVDFAECPT